MSARDDLRKRLEKLNREAMDRPIGLADAVSGREVVSELGDRAFLISNGLGVRDEPADDLGERLRRALEGGHSPARRWIARCCGDGPLSPEDLVFFDIETTGLSATPLFLIGTMAWEAGGLVVRQYFARDYAEEPGVISLFLQDIADRRMLVSFNGKSFDVPYVRARAASTGVPCPIDLEHLDLLHVARRVWGHRLPDCKLQTLERRICGRRRVGDIPGAEIPAAYHRYVRTGDARQMVDCLEHNVLDLVTLADLMLRLPPPA